MYVCMHVYVGMHACIHWFGDGYLQLCIVYVQFCMYYIILVGVYHQSGLYQLYIAKVLVAKVVCTTYNEVAAGGLPI